MILQDPAVPSVQSLMKMFSSEGVVQTEEAERCDEDVGSER